MKKFLHKHLHKVVYAFLWGIAGVFLAGNSWASEAGNTLVKENQQAITVSGRVVSIEDNQGLPGVSIMIKNTSSGTITDINGNYTINVPSEESILVFSFIGFVPEEIIVGSQRVINVSMVADITSLKEVIIIGYGEQKKETVVGSVTQASGEILKRTGGVSNVGAALTGNLPGLITNASTGAPGEENPRIYIRGQSTWGNSEPMYIVDGVERPDFFQTMDINSIESISVLKDASATAVFGSRGANGVIIITTKRGREGKAEITASASSAVKWVSKMPGKYNSYDAIGVRNRAIEYELSTNPNGWVDMIPEAIRDKYRNPANEEEAIRYPDVDWQNVLFKDYAMAYNANVGVQGGTEFVKYFSNIDYQQEGDLFREFDNGRGYTPGYSYDRLNFRSNLDFQLTSTTKLSTNLAGVYAVRKRPRIGVNEFDFWNTAYNGAPDLYVPRYPDGTWAYYAPNPYAGMNSVMNLATSGMNKITDTRFSTTFVLDQNLNMILKGLDFKAILAVDNEFEETNRGVNDANNGPRTMWINPMTGERVYSQVFQNTTNFDFYDQGPRWSVEGGSVTKNLRKLFYQFQLNYAGTIADDHNYSIMGLMNRDETSFNNFVPSYREDWVFRTTYNYKNKFMVEYNGAYNGSEQFAPENRFAFFSSGGVGWNISEEHFMKSLSFVDVLKVRASYGEVGNDRLFGRENLDLFFRERFLFEDQWAYGGTSSLGLVGAGGEASPYNWYRQSRIGNPSIRWETAYKHNLGVEFGFLNGLINGTVDLFSENRKDILIGHDPTGRGRAIPEYFGADAPPANLGRVKSRGYEVTLNLNHTLNNGLNLWANFAMTHAINEVIQKDNPELLFDYQREEGYVINQARTHISNGYYNSWDELYASTPHNANNLAKIPGNYHILDFNGDGVIDAFDSAPFGYSGVPQNTYNLSLGSEWKGFSIFVQFYGVNNVTRQVVFNSLGGRMNNVYDQGTLWSADNMDADTPMPRWLTVPAGYNSGSRFFYDGSYVRLKNAEIAYRFTSNLVQRMGLQSLRVFVNGNNLLLWTDMPDDRESNFAGTGWASQGAYPTIRRANIGLNVTF